MELRPYQEEALSLIKAGFNPPNGFKRQLVVMPTAAGKTILFSKLAEYVAPKRTLILAHREELLEQAKEKLRASTGIDADIEAATRRASLEATVVIASVQSMMREDRLARWPRDHFKLIVTDEAHHVVSPSWQKVLAHFPTFTLGVTATPDRGDKRRINDFFEAVAYETTLIDLIKAGFLARIRVKTIPIRIEMGGVRVVAGDYSADDIGAAIEPHLGEIAKIMARDYSHRRSLAFLPLIATSQSFVEACREEGLRAEHVDGTSSTAHRQGVLERLTSGETQLVSNAMLFTEGIDCPPIDCILPLRPTKIRSLYAQQIGRSTRLHPGKENALILDFLWLTKAHNVIRAADIVARDEEEAQHLGDGDLVEAIEEERVNHLAAILEANKLRKGEEYDLIEFATSIGDIEVADFEPTMHWHEDPVSPGQFNILEKWGLNPHCVKTKGHASQIIDSLIRRSQNNLATYKQVRFLIKQGVEGSHMLSFEEAGRMIQSYVDRWKDKKHASR
jgi:superfamily II DNA or RNA helicase